MAICYYKRRDFANMKEAAQRAIDLDGHLFEALVSFAIALIESGKHNKEDL